jgi:hypothetical protein
MGIPSSQRVQIYRAIMGGACDLDRKQRSMPSQTTGDTVARSKLIMLVWYEIWKERNARVFERKESTNARML